MLHPEIHLFILWQRARYKETAILQDMEQNFTILKKIAITWTPSQVSNNFTRFYGVNLPPNSDKEKECGVGEFLLCIVRDEKPKYAERKTSRGIETVNINMFDAKTQYRQWTNGGHKVHGTNNEQETNHDLTLLIGKNITDFLNDCPNKNLPFENLQKDIEGANGWNTIKHLFYVLNNSTSYVIMRGLTDNEDSEFLDNSDIDILTSDYQNMWYILNGEAIYFHLRPKSKLIIKERVFYFDIWDSKMMYFDPLWTNDMIQKPILFNNMFILNPENDFYCLLYHCLTNKGYIAEKHIAKLQAYKHLFNITENDWNAILVNWLQKKHYEIVQHTDPSNPFNTSNPVIHDYAFRHGKCLRIISSSVNDIITNQKISWISKVFKSDYCYVKAGTPWLINNEKRFLYKIGDGIHFPKIIDSGGDESEQWIKITEMKGNELFHNKWNIRLSHVKKYATQILALLEILYKNNIIHRDIHNSNIFIDKDGNASLIDFGFAIDFREDKKFLCPYNLGMGLSPQYMYSDFYNLASIFEHRWDKMPFVIRFAKELKRINWEHYEDTEFVLKQINATRDCLKQRYSLRDIIEFIIGKYKIRKYLHHPRKLIRRLTPNFDLQKQFINKYTKKIIRKYKKIIS